MGSASSILVNMIKDGKDLFGNEFFEDSPYNIAYFLSAPIVLDTNNFDPSLEGSRWTQEDKQAMEFLKQHSSQIDDYLFQSLCDVKFDQQVGLTLGLQGIFGRDFKNYMLANTECNGKLGLGVSVNSID